METSNEKKVNWDKLDVSGASFWKATRTLRNDTDRNLDKYPNILKGLWKVIYQSTLETRTKPIGDWDMSDL